MLDFIKVGQINKAGEISLICLSLGMVAWLKN
jgi:hypothetical protein